MLCSGVGSQLKISTVLVARLTHVLTKMLTFSMIWQWKIEDWLYDMLLSVVPYQLEQHIVLFQMFWATTKIVHAECQECWPLKSCISECKLPVITSNCTERILPNFFVHMWLWTRPGLTTSTRKPNNRVCCGNIPLHHQWSSFARPSQPARLWRLYFGTVNEFWRLIN